jgi:hypothetical protein
MTATNSLVLALVSLSAISVPFAVVWVIILRRRKREEMINGELRYQAAKYAGWDDDNLAAGDWPPLDQVANGLRAELDRLLSRLDALKEQFHLIGVTDEDALFSYCESRLGLATEEAFRGTFRRAEWIDTISVLFTEISELAARFEESKIGRDLRQWAVEMHTWSGVLTLYSSDLATLPHEKDDKA